MRKLLSAVAVALALVGCGAQPAADARETGASASALVPLTIQTAKGARRYSVEVARTPAEQERGLMFRTEMPADQGMIFPMDPPRPATFWMKNTVLSLDLIFIRADGTIARIAERAMPYSLDLIDSGEPVAAVLELNGGTAATDGIAEGDKVSWPR
ncbi:hypothetical protein CLG96_14415 [Sphingomonas oleivorans]|uniref:DUF192 domain-containing protein n=1 Tax=Sphingomonas oleivorans TaxID=1735121 RepID=A0A2T5FVD0_9SPHN|nr:DUF192 domain-containing protein [Sphingomonas oleivorans]PTQ09397.1 hypothetical protein CLG96_14415 [Sphingomonas oleivorans]